MNFDEAQRHGWLNAIYPADHKQVTADIRSALLSRREYKGECRFSTPLGEVRWMLLHISAMRSPDGATLGFLGTVQDIDDLVKTKESLEHLAQFDTLTGLPNRHLFMDRLKQALLRTSRTSNLALLFIDLDEFKVVNDTLGHEAGDKLLGICAKRLTDAVRKEDTVARLDYDEFIVIADAPIPLSTP